VPHIVHDADDGRLDRLVVERVARQRDLRAERRVAEVAAPERPIDDDHRLRRFRVGRKEPAALGEPHPDRAEELRTDDSRRRLRLHGRAALRG
jgi:hypothetical protein